MLASRWGIHHATSNVQSHMLPRYFSSSRTFNSYSQPMYLAIFFSGVQMNLDRYIDMTQNSDEERYGTVLSEFQFFTYCRSDLSN
jgi:hypothetical protein